jgi:hypothetical protein
MEQRIMNGHRFTYDCVRDPEGNFWTVTCSCGFEEYGSTRAVVRAEAWHHKRRIEEQQPVFQDLIDRVEP